MTLPSKPAPVVLLAGADAAAVASLQPSAEVLSGFGVAVETAVLAGGGTSDVHLGEICAVIVASPDGVLPGAFALAAKVPVIRVPTATADQTGLELLRDTTGNLPCGTDGAAFATMAAGLAGAKNAALFVVAVLALNDERIRVGYAKHRASQTEAVLNHPPPEL